MCGIVGYIGMRNAVPILIEGLQALEYRGYDSAGLALHKSQGNLTLIRASGKLKNLSEKTTADHQSHQAIGHTRWATHGRPTEENAHPHQSTNGKIVVVHNGIFENFLSLRENLLKAKMIFRSETDTECFPHQVQLEMEQGCNFKEGFLRAVSKMEGIYALACIHADEPNRIMIAKNGPPLVIGIGQGEMFVASDVVPLLKHTREVIFLEDGECGEMTAEKTSFFSIEGSPIIKTSTLITYDANTVDKIGFDHFMQKEIAEQPQAISNTLHNFLPVGQEPIPLNLDLSDEVLATFKRIVIVACGTSLHAGLMAKFFIEEFARIPVEVDYASEFRYRHPVLDENTLILGITQSGETADTLAALKEVKLRGLKTMAVCNVQGSSVTRLVDATLLTHAGPEIGVASTKAFTTQLAILFLLALKLGELKKTLPLEDRDSLIQGLRELPSHIDHVIAQQSKLEEWAKVWFKANDFLYLGRGPMYPIALEGALKLKEISYIHAEGYPAGEMKHGPIALIDDQLPIVALLARDSHHDKMVSNLQEAAARGGKILAFVNKGDRALKELTTTVFDLPETHPWLAPLIFIVPLQILAYHIAILRGCDVDQPRNLAKSVTVE